MTEDDIKPPEETEPQSEAEEGEEGEGGEEAGTADSGLTEEEKADLAAEKKSGAKSPKAKRAAAERDWQARQAKAQQKLAAAQRAYDAAQQRLLDLKNELLRGGGDSQALNAQIDEQEQAIARAQAQLETASAELDQVSAAGEAGGYAAGGKEPARLPNGDVNLEGFKKRYRAAKQQVSTLEKRVTLLEQTLTDLARQIREESGVGSPVRRQQLIDQHRKATETLDETNASLAAAKTELEDVTREAALNGLTPAMLE
jgi:predicted  nucleic acid-binding Zn-ribbon protein